MKKPAPAVETRPKIRIKTTAGRLPPVIIDEPTEHEVVARLNNPSESDNSSPGAEIPVQVFLRLLIIYFSHSLLLYDAFKSNKFFLFSRTLLALRHEILLMSRIRPLA